MALSAFLMFFTVTSGMHFRDDQDSSHSISLAPRTGILSRLQPKAGKKKKMPPNCEDNKNSEDCWTADDCFWDAGVCVNHILQSIRNEQEKKEFVSKLKEQYAAENLSFLQDVKELKKMSQEFVRKQQQKAKDIYEKYIRGGDNFSGETSEAINISSEQRRTITEKYEDARQVIGFANVFDDAVRVAMAHLANKRNSNL